MLVCPKCGKRNDETGFIEAFCAECYPINIQLPKKITLLFCKHCNKMLLKGKWIPYNKNVIGEYLIGKCRGDFSAAEYDPDSETITFTILKRGTEAKVKMIVPVELENVTCITCSRISGGYFESIIQLRGDEKRVEKYKKIFLEELSKKTFIIKEKLQKTGGADLYIGKTKEVIKLMQELGLKAKITRKLIGRQEGKRLYRTTFAIRFEK